MKDSAVTSDGGFARKKKHETRGSCRRVIAIGLAGHMPQCAGCGRFVGVNPESGNWDNRTRYVSMCGERLVKIRLLTCSWVLTVELMGGIIPRFLRQNVC